MARPNQTNYRTNSSVKPTEREVRAYRVEQADRILLERVANVRTTLMQPRVGKRSSAAPCAPRSSSSTTSTSNATQNYASTTSSYSGTTFRSSTQYQPARRQARRQQFRPLGGVLNTTYTSAAHLRESKLYLDALERTAQHEARMNAESEAMFQENKQRREEWAEWTRNLYHSGAVRMASEKASTASVASIAQSSVIVEHDQQLAAESEGVNLTGLRPQETHGEQSPPSDQVVAQEADHIQASEAQQAEQVEFGQAGSKNEEVAQYPPLSFPLKVKKVKKQIIVGSTLAATFPAASRQVFQRVLYTDGTRVWIKVQVLGNGMVEAEALGALPQVRKRHLLVEHELEETRKRRLTADHAFQIVETHKFADEMPAEYQRQELDEIDGTAVHVEESKTNSPAEGHDEDAAVALFEEVRTTSGEDRDEIGPTANFLEEVKTTSEEQLGEVGSIVQVEEVQIAFEPELHEGETAAGPHEEAKGASEEEHIEADAAGFHVEEVKATPEAEQPEKGILDVVRSNEGAPQEETPTIGDDRDADWRQRKGKKKVTSSTKRAATQKGDCVDCGKRTYDQPHICRNRHPKMTSSDPLYSRQARIHVDAEAAEKIQPGIEPVIPLVGRGTSVSESAMAFARNIQLFNAATTKRTANGEAQQNATENDEDLMDVGAINSAPANAPTGPRYQSSGGYYVPQREGSMDVVSTFEAFDEMLPPAATGVSAMHQVYQGLDSGVGSLISDKDEDMVMSGTDAQVEEEEDEVMSGVVHTAPQQDVQVRKSLFFAAPIDPRDSNDSSHRHQFVQESWNARSLGQEQYSPSPAHCPGDRDGDVDMIDDTPSTRQAPARRGRGRPQAQDRYGNIDMPDASATPSQLPRRQNDRARDHRQFVDRQFVDRQFVDRQYNAIMSHSRTAPSRPPLRMRDTNFSDSGRRGAQQHYRPQRSLSTTPSTQHDLDREDYARQRMAADAQRRATARGVTRAPRRNGAPSRSDENDIGLRIRGAAKMRGESMRDARYAD